MVSKSLITLLLGSVLFGLPSLAVAQNAWERPSARFSCPKPELQQACTSLNEMIVANDKDVTETLEGRIEGFACFYPYEDRFFLISYVKPATSEDEAVRAQSGTASFSQFKDGQREMFELAFGRWNKFKTLSFYAESKTPSSKCCDVFINDAEMNFGFKYQNLIGSLTTFAVKVRRSTLRFKQFYEAPSKKKGETTQEETSGYCVDLEQLKPHALAPAR
jgi:hypothetical protein